MLFWQDWSHESRKVLAAKVAAHGKRKGVFDTNSAERHGFVQDIHDAISEWVSTSKATKNISDHLSGAAEYLFLELTVDERFTVSPEAAEWTKKFQHALVVKHAEQVFKTALAELDGNAVAQYEVVYDWLSGMQQSDDSINLSGVYLAEAAAHLVRGGYDQLSVKSVRVRKFVEVDVPTFQSYQDIKHELVESKREQMRLNEFKPKVMSAFVRNKLLNNVYLPLIGDNLAKQLGTAGDNTRTDRMGLLLLISPPGYGKTTLMEYVANRLGLTFMKINGPALGHDVVSLDPNEAPNATAAEEVKKLNLALEMGDNVLIYLDDIQHTHSEFLQKFISLCDGQRKIEGVYNGVARTYDLRGKKVGVVMAGNPYTETGGKFQIPDMLANRADTYNLGDILGGHAEDFKASYIENSLTSNGVLSKLSSRSQKDVYTVMHIASTGSQEGVDFEGNYTPAEIDEMVKVCKHLYRVRDAILRVNLEYIRSAAQEDAYREEPAFKLQGSYRNMNRIAEKVLPLMTDQEVVGLISDHYENESQTLTSGAESNLLKFKEMENLATEEEQKRWLKIKKDFNQNQLLGGADENDPVARVVAQMTTFTDGLESIRAGIHQAAESYTKPQSLTESTIAHLEKIISGLRAVPVEVDINVMAADSDESGVSDIESVDEDMPVTIEPTIRQGEQLEDPSE